MEEEIIDNKENIAGGKFSRLVKSLPSLSTDFCVINKNFVEVDRFLTSVLSDKNLYLHFLCIRLR